MCLVSAVGGCGTDCQIINRMRDSADTTRVGVEIGTLSLRRSHCADTVRIEAMSRPPSWWIIPLPAETHSIDNLQPYCSRCHVVKTAAERSAKRKPPIRG